MLVDFWAPWCGPCRQLTPVLEKVVRAARGAVRLVKMNIDEHPQIAGQLGIQSIPAVIAFKNGQPLDGFMGALPESQVAAFIERIAGPVGPSDAERALEMAGELLETGDFPGAAQLYTGVLEAEPDNLAGARRAGALLPQPGRDRTGARPACRADAGAGTVTRPISGARAAVEAAAQAESLGRPEEMLGRPAARPWTTTRPASTWRWRSTARATAPAPPSSCWI